MVEMETRIEKWAAGATKKADIKGKLIEFAWKLKKENYADSTIKNSVRALRWLLKYGANIYDPETVKEVLARRDNWCEATKENIATVYSRFASMNGIEWVKPKYRRCQKIPFIPLESEIDSLIASCGRKTATFLQLLKETGMRSGEAIRLKWIDVDFRQNIIRLNVPEKNSNPRVFKVSHELIAMLNALPKTGEELFGSKLKTMRYNFQRQRNRLTFKLQNPRLKQITFHTFRHWKATMEYQKTRDILYVMKLLGHKNINNTLIYTQLVNFESEEFHSAIARNVEEARQLIEAGFEYVCTTTDVMLFRKRK